MTAELDALKNEVLASCEGFNRKDVGAWMDPFHEDAITYNTGFMLLSTIRPMADGIIASSKTFNVSNLDGRIVADTAVIFGDYQWDMEDGSSITGAFTSTHVRVDGQWKTLATHYTRT